MSLDVSLVSKEPVKKVCNHCDSDYEDFENVFEYNITHNLTKMADEAGIYELLWKPETIGIKKSGDLIKGLKEGLKLLKSKPDFFKKFNPRNGWGCYDDLVHFIEKYLEKCEEYPNCNIYIGR